MATGSYVYRDAYYGQRLILTLSRSGTKVSYTLKIQSTGSYAAPVSWSLSGAVSRSGTTQVSGGAFNVSFTQTLATGSFTRSSAGTVSASATVFWGGKPKVSASIGAGVTKPSAAPSNFAISTAGVLSWGRPARANKFRRRRSINGADSTYVDLGNILSRTESMNTLDSQYAFWVFGGNEAGWGPASGRQYFYTKPKTPGKPSFQSDGSIKFTLPQRYCNSVLIERSDGSTVSLGKVTTWKDDLTTRPLSVDTKYRVRGIAGVPSTSVKIGTSDWSAWSNPAGEIALAAPNITQATQRRWSSSTNKADPMGNRIRVSMRYSAPTTYQGSPNTLTLKYRVRQTDGSWSSFATVGSNPGGAVHREWTSTHPSGGVAIDKSYDVEVQITDKAGQVVTQTIRVPTAEVTASFGKKGVGVGKVWEQGSLDVGGDIYYANGYGLTFFDDNRDEQQDPSWYRSRFPRGFYREFKQVSTMSPALPVGHKASFFMMETIIPWSQSSTGYPIYQRAELSNIGGEMWRLWRSEAASDTWGPWNGVGGSTHLIINGKAYPRTGRISVTRPTLSANAGGYAATWTIDPPFVPPAGWSFQAHTPNTNGYGFVFFSNRGRLTTTGKLTLRFWGNKSETTLNSIGWTLVKEE